MGQFKKFDALLTDPSVDLEKLCEDMGWFDKLPYPEKVKVMAKLKARHQTLADFYKEYSKKKPDASTASAKTAPADKKGVSDFNKQYGSPSENDGKVKVINPGKSSKQEMDAFNKQYGK
jgi:hypothetical protein